MYLNFEVRKEKQMRFLALLDLFRIVRGTLKIITSRKLFHIVFNHFPQFFEKIYQKYAVFSKKNSIHYDRIKSTVF